MYKYNNSKLKRTLRHMLLIGIIASLFAFAAFALDGKVDTDVLRVRAETSTESAEVGRVRRNDTLDITGRFGEWYVINHGGETRYVFTDYVELPDNITVNTTMGIIKGGTINVRSEPTTESEVVTKLAKGTAVLINSIKDGWYEISSVDYEGYVRGDYLDVLSLTYSKSEKTERKEKAVTTSTGTIDIRDDDGGEEVALTYSVPENYEISSERQKLLEYAYKYLGVGYKYGGASPEGFDCSGFTCYVFKNFGYKLNRSSSAQINDGTEISKSELVPGDLVFFSRGGKAVGHVGIYVGDGKFIHSTSPGDVVSITELTDSYYSRRYVGARRVLDL
jgi:uncharacterized protein YgiM (DUF1202 family)